LVKPFVFTLKIKKIIGREFCNLNQENKTKSIVKFLRVVLFVLGLVCLAEVAYVYYMLSFVDSPYLIVGIILCSLSVYWAKRKKGD